MSSLRWLQASHRVSDWVFRHLTCMNRQYRSATHAEIVQPRLDHFKALSRLDRDLLVAPPLKYLEKLQKVDHSIATNAKIAADIFFHGINLVNSHHPGALHVRENDCQGFATPSDIAIVRATIRQFYRDWSEEGAVERNVCHGQVLKDLSAEFTTVADRSQVRVLIPGAGLCRLAFDIASSGYSTEANEISYHQLLASHFVLSRTTSTPSRELYPFALSFSNHLSREAQFEKVLIPGVHAGTVLGKMPFTSAISSPFSLESEDACLTLNATDFPSEYGGAKNRGSFDAVATVFFLDTAPNLLRYMETVHNCLKRGGIWINVGPLLWNCAENGPGGRREGDIDDDEACKARHCNAFDNDGTPMAKLEFSEDEVLLLLEQYGFHIEKHDICIGEVGYIMDPKSMLQNLYRVSHWVARKL
jgi:carnosine N-methyltransferase